MRREAGVIEDVYSDPLGGRLAADAAAGDTTITVQDATDFEATGGTFHDAADNQIDYTAVDDETGIITLTYPLPADLAEGDRIRIWDTVNDEQATELRAQIALPGRLANDDSVDAAVVAPLDAFLEEGPRPVGKGERVVIADEADDGDWEVVKFKGKRARLKASASEVQQGLPDWEQAGPLSSNVALPADTWTTVYTFDLAAGWWLINAGVIIEGDPSSDAPAQARISWSAGPVFHSGGLPGAEFQVRAGSASLHTLASVALSTLAQVVADATIFLECKPFGVDMTARMSDSTGDVGGAGLVAVQISATA